MFTNSNFYEYAIFYFYLMTLCVNIIIWSTIFLLYFLSFLNLLFKYKFCLSNLNCQLFKVSGDIQEWWSCFWSLQIAFPEQYCAAESFSAVGSRLGAWIWWWIWLWRRRIWVWSWSRWSLWWWIFIWVWVLFCITVIQHKKSI